MQFTSSIQRGQITLTFDGKPSESIRAALKASGFRWSPAGGYWWRSKVAGSAEFIAWLRTQIDRESGVRRPDGPCWECKDPAGFFRPFGAATPVYCDACHAKHLAKEVSKFVQPAWR